MSLGQPGVHNESIKEKEKTKKKKSIDTATQCQHQYPHTSAHMNILTHIQKYRTKWQAQSALG